VFLLDDLIMAPGKAMYAIFEQLAKKARDEWLDDEGVKRDLQDLYAMLESGSISDREFESRECRLLERLQQIAAMKFQERWGSDASTPALSPAPAAVLDVQPERHEVTKKKSMPSMPMLDDVFASLMSPDGPGKLGLPDPSTLGAPEPSKLGLPEPSKLGSYTDTTESPTPAPERRPTAPATFERQSVPVVGQLSISQVIDSALRALSVLKMKMSSVTSVTRDDEGWRLTVELVERRSVPDTSDLLGIYELHLDEGGNLLRYERTRMRRRCDLSW
jgi:hypothetical protein